jgi:hypothetical protein
MQTDDFDVQGVVAYWLTEAKESLEVADHSEKRPTIPTHSFSVIWRWRKLSKLYM